MPVSSLTDRPGPGPLLYPRLGREWGRALVSAHAGIEPGALRAFGRLDHPDAAPAATGGTPASLDRLATVQRAVREVADGAGFPSPLVRGREQTFDRPCGGALYRSMDIVPADAAAEDVWTFLTLVVVPEIGPWRFPDRSEERILGRPRNVLRRLWWRAWALGPDLDSAPEGCSPLGEDEFVGIMERPSLGGDPRIARAVRDAIWRMEPALGGAARSDAARQLTRQFRASMSYVCVEALSDAELAALVDEAAASAVSSSR
jgi:hypothetical protein